MSTESWTSLLATFAAIFFLIGSSFSEKAPYSSFAKDATFAPPAMFYDYIVVGGGTSGCALAATLSQGSKVLLVERGGLPYGNPTITNINGFAATLEDTSPSSPSQFFISTDGVFNHRSRVLGGGSALNAGFYSRAESGYISRMGWDQRLVNESYEWVEKKVAFEPALTAWQSAVRDGLLEAGVGPNNGFTFDHLPGTKVGGTIFDQNGNRHTAADFLEYADPTKITVYLHATVQQLLFQEAEGNGRPPRPRAYGVYFKDSKGHNHVAYLNGGSTNEIILSAGALGSPQILMLSGIGPAQHLKSQDIRVVLDQPMVGQGMSDNPMNGLMIPSPRPLDISLIQVVGITKFGSYIESSSGAFAFDWVRAVAQKFQSLFNQSSAGNRIDINPNSNLQAGMIIEKVMGPFSSGHLELLNKDPNENPRVTFNYFKDPRDLQRCVEGMEMIGRVIESGAFSNYRYPFTPVQGLMNTMLSLPVNLRPRRIITASFSFEEFCQDTVMTIWHYHGGCQVGRVVDPNYRVVGVDRLRVVDGSTFIESPGTNPQATVMMLGRYMGQRILRDRVLFKGNKE